VDHLDLRAVDRAVFVVDPGGGEQLGGDQLVARNT